MVEAPDYSGVLEMNKEEVKYVERPEKGRRSPCDW